MHVTPRSSLLIFAISLATAIVYADTPTSFELTGGPDKVFVVQREQLWKIGRLWNVPDETTRQLVERFYENLWDKKLSELEAFRQAQLAILRGDGTTRKASHHWAAFFLSGDWR